MSEAMNKQAADLTNLNNMYNLINLLQNMILNIGLIEEGTIGQVLTVANANLYQIAAQQYGDATQWTVIANANGLSDPMIESTLSATVSNNTIGYTTIEIDGMPLSPQSITFIVNGQIYTYNVSSTDTLNSITTNMAKFIKNAFAIANMVFFPNPYTVSNTVTIERIISLVIPQQASVRSGGILSF